MRGFMDASFIRSLQDRAEERRARIGIGIWNADEELIASLHSAERFAELLLVGDLGEDCPFDHMNSNEPWRDLVRLLASGEIDGAVRGNLPAGRSMRALVDRFGLPVRRLALIELFGWSFLLGPVGIDEGETPSARLDLLLGGKAPARAGRLPGGSSLWREDGGPGRSERVDTSLLEGDQIAARAAEAGINAEHKGILIESCRGDDIVIAPEGISGNLIFRTLMLLCGAQSYGAPVITERMDWIFIDSSRARSGFDGPVMLAGALAGMRGRDAIEYLDCFSTAIFARLQVCCTPPNP